MNPGFVPINFLCTRQFRQVLSTSLPQHQCATKAETAPLILNEQYDEARSISQSQVQQSLMAPMPAYQLPTVPYVHPAAALSSREQVTAPLSSSYSFPQYTQMPPVVAAPQTLPSVSVPGLNITALAVPSLQPFSQSLKRPEYLMPLRPLHAAPSHRFHTLLMTMKGSLRTSN